MSKEINLLTKYPKSKRNIDVRQNNKTLENIRIAKKFDFDYFDGERKFGYGGYKYNKKYWEKVILDFIKFYKLDNKSSVLDVGCAKGFFLFELKKKLPGIKIKGIDISQYAINNSKKEVSKFLTVGNAKKLPFKDKSFDLVVSFVTLHNLNREDCGKALREIERVKKDYSFITLDAYSNNIEKKRMQKWNLTALTYMHIKEWVVFFEKNNYTGDYYWFKP